MSTTQTTLPAVPAAAEREVDTSLERLRRHRNDAKNAMVVSMGALVLTGYLMDHGGRNYRHAARVAHLAAGVALLGTAYWHHTLYLPGAAGRR
ncbi:conserved protein of unknown function [Rhodovastum atsumiense]|uniref:hypothetical protein n=1 Tax=Rhodovastum atsumiense TaxID=504468 RepID=UPI001EF0A3F7|nr:hypothetical protein [Rhodovastum atsumiense]CAH2601868.1 conserved protein of unknown function [Rhodovastum atsumiense]